MKKFFLCLALTFSFEVLSYAQNFPFLDGDRELHSAIHLVDKIENKMDAVFRQGVFSSEDSSIFQTIIEEMVIDSNMVSLSAAVVDIHGASWSGSANKDDVSESAKVRPGDIFGIGSNTKSLTSAAILLLMEDGLLSLEDTLGKWLPQYNFIDPGITIRQCLQMTSGIFNFTDHPNFALQVFGMPDKIWTPQEILTTFVKEPLFDKGTSWAYSNTNYVLAGMIVEEASGMPYHEFVRTRILEPLELESFAYYPTEEPKGEMAHAWLDINGDGTPEDLSELGLSLKAFFSAAGAAGAYTATVHDLAEWFKKLSDGMLLQPSSLEQMKSVYQLQPNVGYGLGLLIIQVAFGELIGHGGSIVYQSSGYYISPAGVSIMCIANFAEDEPSLIPTANLLAQAYFSILAYSQNILFHPKDYKYNSLVYDDLVIHSTGKMINSCHIYSLQSGKGIFAQNNVFKKHLNIDTGNWSPGVYVGVLTDTQGAKVPIKMVKAR